jgi:hypothetical protein
MNLEATLAAALRGDSPIDDTSVSLDLVDAAEAHLVDALLARRLASTGPLSTSPAACPERSRGGARLNALAAAHAALSVAHDRELTRALGHLAAAGVSPVVIKGAHLAHTIYPSPDLRPRGDSDLVIAQDEQAALVAHLETAGYHRMDHVRGRLILGQCHFQRTDDLGVKHALDVHWRVAAPLVFRHVLPAAELRRSRVPLPALGPDAWGPRRAHALIIACVHLVAHHRHSPLLLWLHDIARLAEAFDQDEARAFLDTAAAAGVSAVCAAALNHARRYFDGPALLSLALGAETAGRARAEPSARVLTAARPIDDVWLDLQVSEGWRERAALLREHLWPDAQYMRGRAGGGGWLPLAYARRALAGAGKWMAPRARNDSKTTSP